MSKVSLVVGLGNPGAEYKETRHNAGVWWVKKLAEKYGVNWSLDQKFHGFCARIKTESIDCRLLLPVTYMNRSGLAVSAILKYYQISEQQMAVAHDEIDLPPGCLKLKCGGGAGGHNGLKDIIQATGSREFWRVRIGVGHPGHKNHVVNYVLKRPSGAEFESIDHAIFDSLSYQEAILSGDWALAMNAVNQKKIQD